MKRTDDAVAFVVPVYNKARWLPRVLDQIAAQRGSFAREYIFVDDGSTDESLAILKRMTAGWPEVTIVEQANHGSAHATNRGIERVSAPFIKLCDADDLLAADATAVLLSALRRSEEAVLAYGDAAFYDIESEIDLDADLLGAPTTIVRRPLRAALRNSICNPTQMLARSDVVKRCGGCDERVRFSQENALVLRLAAEGSIVRTSATVAFLPRDVPCRLSADQGRVLRDVTLHLANFVRDNPSLSLSLKQFACRRAASRCRRFVARRGGGKDLLRQATGLYLRSHAAFIERCAQVLDTSREARG